MSCSHGYLCLLPSVSPLFLRSFPLAFPHSLSAPIFSPPLRDNWSGENCYWGLHDPALSVLLFLSREKGICLQSPGGPMGFRFPFHPSHFSLFLSLSSFLQSLYFSCFLPSLHPCSPADPLLSERQGSHPLMPNPQWLSTIRSWLRQTHTCTACLLSVPPPRAVFPEPEPHPRWPCQPWVPGEIRCNHSPVPAGLYLMLACL